MKYSKMLRELFFDISLNIEDVFLLESYQIKYLAERISHKAFATLIRKYPFVKDFLVLKAPSIGHFVDSVLKANEEVNDEELIKEYSDALLWEIADLIVYNKFPEIYDERVKFNWSIDEIILKESLIGKVVADVGRGQECLHSFWRHMQKPYSL
jgi:hypothetical protein